MRAFRSEGKLFYIITALLCVAAIVAVNIIFRTKKPAPTPEESSNIRTSVILTEPPVQTTVQTTERTETVQTTAAPETAAPTECVTEPAPENRSRSCPSTPHRQLSIFRRTGEVPISRARCSSATRGRRDSCCTPA